MCERSRAQQPVLFEFLSDLSFLHLSVLFLFDDEDMGANFDPTVLESPLMSLYLWSGRKELRFFFFAGTRFVRDAGTER